MTEKTGVAASRSATINGYMSEVRAFDLLKQSYLVLLTHAKARDIPVGKLALAAERSAAWVNKLGSSDEGGSLKSIDLVCRAFGKELGITLHPHELLQPQLLAIRLADLDTARVSGVTDPVSLSVYTPPSNVHSDVKGVPDAGKLAASVSALERKVAALEKQQADNTAVLFGSFRALRLRFKSAMRDAGKPDKIAPGADRAQAGTRRRTRDARGNLSKGGR